MMSTPLPTLIRAACERDVEAICQIYNHYVVHTTVSFEEERVGQLEMAERLSNVQRAGLPWLVLEQAGQLCGYAYATPWRVRKAYRFSVEITVYLATEQQGKGYGSALYQALFEQLKTCGCHVAIAGITQPNPASVALHEKFGMRQVGLFTEVGFKFGAWRDVGYWQRAL